MGRMTDIDTAKIRAEFVQTRHSQVDVTIGALCDALDAAEARIRAALAFAADPQGDDYSPNIERALTAD